MRPHLSILLFVYVMKINLVDCHQSNGSAAIIQLLSPAGNDQCPLWHFFNVTTNLCECNTASSIILKCTGQGIKLRVGHCMTYEEQDKDSPIYIAHCNYFNGNFSTSDNGRYIELPLRSASELNDVMCEPMNQMGRLCSECIEDIGFRLD